MDNDSSHTSKRVEQYVEDCGERVRLYPLPEWSPQSNLVELSGGLYTRWQAAIILLA